MTPSQRLKAAMNRLLFQVRQIIAWSRPGYSDDANGTCTWQPTDKITQIALQALLRQYPLLEAFQYEMSLTRWRENLNFITMLHQSRWRSPSPQKPLRVLEIGIKNWSTLPALVAYLTQQHSGDLSVDGIEVDLWQVYKSLHSRYDALTHHMGQASQKANKLLETRHLTLKAIEGDIQAHKAQPYDLIIWSLPFVALDTHLAWGLPTEFYGPEERLAHVVEHLLAPHGTLISTHQGQQEAKTHYDTLGRLDITVAQQGLCEQPYWTWQYPRVLQVSTKKHPQPVAVGVFVESNCESRV